MASLIENLISVLEKENMEYNQLLSLSLDKTTVIVKGDIAGLQEVMAEEQKIIEKINRLESIREESIRDIANVLNIPQDELKLDRLIKMLENQPKEYNELNRVRDALKKTMNQMVRVNDNNKVLLQESIDMIEFELNLTRSTMRAPETANYGRNAYNDAGNGSGFTSFDAKQ